MLPNFLKKAFIVVAAATTLSGCYLERPQHGRHGGRDRDRDRPHDNRRPKYEPRKQPNHYPAPRPGHRN